MGIGKVIRNKTLSVEQIPKNVKAKQIEVVHPQQGNNDDLEDKVNIPEGFEDSDAESETLSDKLRKIDAYTEPGQSSKQKGGKENHQVWAMEMEDNGVSTNQFLSQKIQSMEKPDNLKDIEVATDMEISS